MLPCVFAQIRKEKHMKRMPTKGPTAKREGPKFVSAVQRMLKSVGRSPNSTVIIKPPAKKK